jgi:Sec-independent protein translocase protein TatA
MFEGWFNPLHVFSPKKLPVLGRGVGDGIRGLRIGNERAWELFESKKL